MNTLINFSIGAAMLVVLACAHLLDGPDDWQQMRDTADELQAAQARAQAQERFERAARAACGSENAGYQVRADGALQCFTKRGHRTAVVAGVAP